MLDKMLLNLRRQFHCMYVLRPDCLDHSDEDIMTPRSEANINCASEEIFESGTAQLYSAKRWQRQESTEQYQFNDAPPESRVPLKSWSTLLDLSGKSDATRGCKSRIDGKEQRASESGENHQNNARTFEQCLESTEKCSQVNVFPNFTSQLDLQSSRNSGSGLIMRYPVSDQPNYNPKQEGASLPRNWHFGNITKELWIKLQIFYDERRLAVKALFWIGDVNEHDALFRSEGFIKSNPLPKSVNVDFRDRLQFHFTTPDKKCYRFNDNNKSREVDLHEICNQGHSIYGLVIDLDPNEIEESYIVIQCGLSINSEELDWANEIRFRNLERHDDHRIRPLEKLEALHHPTASNHIYINSDCNNQSETTIGIQATDKATVYQDNENCKTFVGGRYQM